MWLALQEHHASLAPGLPGLETRADAESWARRRRSYELWLAEPDTFLLLAELAGEPVGYALVRVVEGFHSYGPSDRMASVETLSVLPVALARALTLRRR